jgi:hypothetical protein
MVRQVTKEQSLKCGSSFERAGKYAMFERGSGLKFFSSTRGFDLVLGGEA